MEKLNKLGQVFFGISIIGFVIQQFIDSGFRPFILPQWPAWIPGGVVWVYLVSLALLFAGAAIIFNWKARTVSLWTGVGFLFLFVAFHVPYRLNNNPDILGAWTIDFKIFGYSGGAFVTAASFRKGNQSVLTRAFEKLIPCGPIFFSIMLIIFGTDHFLYVDGVKTLIPNWIPGKEFWTYFTGVALIASGVSIITKIGIRQACLLLSIMLILWFLLLHIPRAVNNPYDRNKGNELTSVFQVLGFTGIVFLIYVNSVLNRKSHTLNYI